MDRLALAPGQNQPLQPQPRQLLADRRLTLPKALFKLAHRHFAAGKKPEDLQPAFVTQRLEQRGQAFGLRRRKTRKPQSSCVFPARIADLDVDAIKRHLLAPCNLRL